MALEDVVFFRSLAMGRIRRDQSLKSAYEVSTLLAYPFLVTLRGWG